MSVKLWSLIWLWYRYGCYWLKKFSLRWRKLHIVMTIDFIRHIGVPAQNVSYSCKPTPGTFCTTSILAFSSRRNLIFVIMVLCLIIGCGNKTGKILPTDGKSKFFSVSQGARVHGRVNCGAKNKMDLRSADQRGLNWLYFRKWPGLQEAFRVRRAC